MKHITNIIIAIILAFGLIATGQFIKDGLIAINSADRYVTVKGLAERDVKADLAIWPIQFKVADNILGDAQTELTRQTKIIQAFLINHGISDGEITTNRVMINDAMANQYRNNPITARYAIDKTLLVRTNNVDAVEKAAQNIGDLIADGVMIGYGATPQYSYTTLNDIKPEMIAAATKNARDAAQQFANDSGASVGAIKSATQGYFSINARDDIPGMPAASALQKNVRVVSTVQYYIQ